MEGDKADVQLKIGSAKQELQTEKQKLQQIQIAFDRITIEEEVQQENVDRVINDALELQRNFVAESTKLNKEIQSLHKHMLENNFWIQETNYLAEKIGELSRDRVESVRAKQAMWDMELSHLEQQVAAMVDIEPTTAVQIQPAAVASTVTVAQSEAGAQSVVNKDPPQAPQATPFPSLPMDYINDDFYAADNSASMPPKQDVAWYRGLTKRSR